MNDNLLNKIKQKFNLNLKGKIILGSIVLVTIMAGINISYTYFTFSSDKKMYLYETLLRKSEGLESAIETLESTYKSITNTYTRLISDGNQNVVEILETDKKIIGVYKVKVSESDFWDKLYESKSIKSALGKNKSINYLSERLKDELKKAKKLEDIESKMHIFTENDKVELVLLINKVSEESFIVYLISPKELNQLLLSDSIYSNLIVSNYDLGRSQSNLAKQIIKSTIPNTNQGSIEVSVNNQSKIASYIISNQGRLVISYLDKGLVTNVAIFLVVKTLLFSLFLLALCSAAGIYFAYHITYPLNKLTEHSKEIGKGNFKQDIQITSTDEIGTLASSFNTMSREISNLLKAKEGLITNLEHANKELKKYMTKLESMVEARTIELKNLNTHMQLMINSMDQGLLVISENMICGDVYTRACEKIFNCEIKNENFTKLINLKEEERESFEQWIQIIFSEMIPFESAVDLGVKLVELKSDDGAIKKIELEYYPMKNEEEKIINLVVVATDKTEEYLAKQVSEKEREHVKRILKITKYKRHFQSFTEDLYKLINESNDELLKGHDKLNLSALQLNLHTINGGVGSYYLNELRSKVVEFENVLSRIKSGELENSKEVIEGLKVKILEIKNDFYKELVAIDSELLTTYSINKKKYEFSEDELNEFEKVFVAKGAKDEFVNCFRKERIKDYLDQYSELCTDVSSKLDKKMYPLVINDYGIKIKPEKYLEVLNSIVHIFRNSVDHGLERPDERVAKGKDEKGRIIVNVEEEKSKLLISIEDDGKGIDTNRLVEKYEQMNPDEKRIFKNENDIYNLIFENSLSTRDEVSQFSGRGVGMSAVKESIEKIGGTIEVKSIKDKGTCFKIEMPT